MLTRPRYEPKPMNPLSDQKEWGVYDTFTQTLTSEFRGTKAGAISAAGRLNRAYARAMAPPSDIARYML